MLKRMLTAALLGGAVTALAMSLWPPGRPAPPAPLSARQAPAARPPAAPAALRERFLGVVLARESVDIAARTEGRLVDARVRLGDAVRRDQVLATLERRMQQSDLAMASAALRAAEAEAERAALEVEQAQDRLRRVQSLFPGAEGGGGPAAVSGEELDRARYQARIAEARLSAARATVNERRARVEQGRVAFEEAEIRAPFDGTITGRYADSGAAVARGAPILRLISSALLCRFAVPEEHAARVAPGQAITADVGEGEAAIRAVPGVVEKVAPEVDAAAGMVLVEARLELGPAEGRLLAGRVARVSLTEVPHGQ